MPHKCLHIKYNIVYLYKKNIWLQTKVERLLFQNQNSVWHTNNRHWKKHVIIFCSIDEFQSWSYGSWIYNYLCNQCLSPLMLWGWTHSWWGVLDTTLCGKVCQWLTTCPWFSLGTLVFSTNKTDHHHITEIVL